MKLPIITIACLFLLSGCATLFSEKSDKITIETEPSGAEVYLGVEQLGKTPLVHTFDRDTFKHTTLNIKKEGYKTKELRLGRTLDKKALFNIGFILTTAGASSWATDAFSDAMIEYKPKSYFIDLEQNDTAAGNILKKMRRRQRVFTLLNYDSLIIDISRNDGPYLHAYYKINTQKEDYSLFLKKVNNNAHQLLDQKDGLALFYALETQVR